MKSGNSRGFTLIEVVIAMFILAFVFTAIISAFRTTVDNVSFVEEHQLAYWVGDNYLVQKLTESTFPKLGQTRSTSKMANRNWLVVANVEQTLDKNTRKITLEVFASARPDKPIVELSGYKSKVVNW
jgi:general secretion pathway protein I